MRSKNILKIRNFYEFYLNNRKSTTPITYSKYINVFNKFIEEMTLLMIQKGISFYLPQSLGSIYITKVKPSRFFIDNVWSNLNVYPVDYKSTLELWKKLYPDVTKRSDYKKIKNKPLVRFDNKSTDGYVFRFNWDTVGNMIKNKSFYNFSARYKAKKLLHEYLKNPLNPRNFRERSLKINKIIKNVEW